MTRQEPASKQCPICNFVECRKLIDWKDFEILKCKQCQLIYCSPIPTDDYLENFYQGFLFKPPLPVEIRKKVNQKVKELRKQFQLWDSDVYRSSSFFDYGGGVGIAYGAAVNLGLNAYYYDLDKAAIDFAQRIFGLKNKHIIKNLHGNTQKFDYILADNVIEHVRDPAEFVYQLASRLMKGGKLIIKTPHGANSETYLNPLIPGFSRIEIYGGRMDATQMAQIGQDGD
jgi:SAM-dependent methyltransferase